MLPPHLDALKKLLDGKGFVGRTAYEDRILEELDAVDKDLDKREIIESTKAREKYGRTGGPSLVGPDPGRCPMCGK